jgi:hypothetical protein
MPAVKLKENPKSCQLADSTAGVAPNAYPKPYIWLLVIFIGEILSCNILQSVEIGV